MCYSRKLRNYISVNPSKALRNCKVKVTLLLPGRIWLRWRARGELPHCFQQWRHFVDALGCFQEAICVIRWIDTKMNRRLVSRLKRINFISGPHFFLSQTRKSYRETTSSTPWTMAWWCVDWRGLSRKRRGQRLMLEKRKGWVIALLRGYP